jgi:hypothetical protein
MLQINTNKLVINFILDIREQDESSNHTSSSASLELGLHISVPHVRGACEQRSDTVRGHSKENVILVGDWLSAGYPIGLCRVSKIFGVLLNIVQILKGVVLALADGCWGTRVEIER